MMNDNCWKQFCRAVSADSQCILIRDDLTSPCVLESCSRSVMDINGRANKKPSLNISQPEAGLFWMLPKNADVYIKCRRHMR